MNFSIAIVLTFLTGPLLSRRSPLRPVAIYVVRALRKTHPANPAANDTAPHVRKVAEFP
jgi:hypothetical protein